MRENADQNNSEYGHFICSVTRTAITYSKLTMETPEQGVLFDSHLPHLSNSIFRQSPVSTPKLSHIQLLSNSTPESVYPQCHISIPPENKLNIRFQGV